MNMYIELFRISTLFSFLFICYDCFIKDIPFKFMRICYAIAFLACCYTGKLGDIFICFLIVMAYLDARKRHIRSQAEQQHCKQCAN